MAITLKQHLQKPKTGSLGLNSNASSGDKSHKDSFRRREELFFSHECPKIFRNTHLEVNEFMPQYLVDFGIEWAKNPTSLMITGNVGTGKTHYAFALLREIFKQHGSEYWPRYYTSPKIDSMLLESTKDGSERYLLNELAMQDLLFIDDFGRETKSDRIQRQYFEMFDARYREDMPTIVTSNFTLQQLSFHLGEATVSRMQPWESIEFSGTEDFRAR